MLERIEALEAELPDTGGRLPDPEVLGDQHLLLSVGRRLKESYEIL